jgi:hypothetical protein
MEVKFTKTIGGYAKDQVTKLMPTQAQKLIKLGVAVAVTNETKDQPTRIVATDKTIKKVI